MFFLATKNHLGENPLHIACRYSSIDVVATICKDKLLPAYFNCEDGLHLTPLMSTIKYATVDHPLKAIKTINMLIAKGAKVSYRNKKGETAIHLAVRANNPHLVTFLLKQKADSSLCDANGDTALHLAIKLNLSVVEVLIKEGANFKIKDKLGRTALRHALDKGRQDVVNQLLIAGAQVDKEDIPIAAKGGFTSVFEQLISAGTNPNIRCGYKTSFTIALENGHIEIAER